MFEDLTRIAIESPTAIAAFELEDRLRHLHPAAVAHDDAWCVELDADAVQLDEIRAVVRRWLHEIGVTSTFIRYAGERHRVVVAGIGDTADLADAVASDS